MTIQYPETSTDVPQTTGNIPTCLKSDSKRTLINSNQPVCNYSILYSTLTDMNGYKNVQIHSAKNKNLKHTNNKNLVEH